MNVRFPPIADVASLAAAFNHPSRKFGKPLNHPAVRVYLFWMAEQWIEASLALDLIGSSDPILQRAHAGLIASRARSLLIEDDRHDDVEIPVKFWWAGAGEALNRDWSSGDFSTWIDHAEHWKAFGVTFGLAGLLEMLPFERRGVTARSLSVAGSPDWLTAKAARQFAYDEGGINPASAGSAILSQAKLGFLTARAVLAKGVEGGARVEPCHWETREWDVPHWFWQNFTGEGTSSQVWEKGTFAGRGTAPTGLRSITLAGVHFLRESLEVLRPPTSSRAATEQPTARNSGGRPPAAFADELMCAIWALIYQGDLKPVRQAEIERAMLDWAVANGHELGTTAARDKARKVFAALKAEVENPGA